MPLQVGKEAIFCLDFARDKFDYVPFETTILGLVYRKASSDRIAFVFDSENLSLSCGKVKTEMEKLGAGLLSAGLKSGDRILICGNNHSAVIMAGLGAARAGLIFSIGSPNLQSTQQLKHFLSQGEFNAFLHFGPSDQAYQQMLSICPEIQNCARGKLKMKALPKLTHIIFADEDHKHSGCYTLSEIFVKGDTEQIAKLPKYEAWDPHAIAVIQFTAGSTGLPKAVGLSAYQIINGARIASAAIGIKRETVLCCALPLHRIPVFALAVFSPFLFESCVIFPAPSPLPKPLFESIQKHQCSTLLSNAAALRLLLRTQPLTQNKKLLLPSIDTVILLGERVSADLLISIDTMMPKAKKIAVGMLSTELGCVPILSDNTTNLIKSFGKVLNGYEASIKPIQNLKNDGIGELLLKPLSRTKFLGYAPFESTEQAEWVNTGDVVCIQPDGNLELIAHHKEDLVFDKIGRLVEHWRLERLLAQLAKCVQVVQVKNSVVAVVVPKKSNNAFNVAEFKKEMIEICRESGVEPPDQLAVLNDNDLPRVNTKIQKYKIREELNAKKVPLY